MNILINKLEMLFPKKDGRVLKSLFLRRGLSIKRRTLCSLASLQAISDWDNLSTMLRVVIVNRKDVEVVYEVLLQGYLFCGYPRAIESFFCLENVLREKNIRLSRKMPILMVSSEKAMKRGKNLAKRINGSKFDKIYDKISALSPDLGYLMLVEGYGNILSRKTLDIKTRELAVVASLSASGANRQLNSHIRGALNVGCRALEIREAILSGQPWVGKKAILKSLMTWSKVTGLPATTEGIAGDIGIGGV